MSTEEKKRRRAYAIGEEVHVEVPERDKLALPPEYQNITKSITRRIRFGNQGFIYELEGVVSKRGVPFWVAEDWIAIM